MTENAGDVNSVRAVDSDSIASVAPLLIAFASVGLFFLVNTQILEDWRVYSFDDGTYSHAYLIPFMSAFIVYTGWKRGGVRPRFSWGFGVALIGCLVLYQWVDLAHQRFLARSLVPLCLCLTLLTVFRADRYVLGSAALLWFVTPVWGPINELLQWGSVRAVAAIMSYTDIPTFVYGEYVQIPAGTFEIADGCSGLRYVIAILALVSIYSVLYLRRFRSVVILTLVALLGAMLTNWLRIVALILIGHFTEMESSLISDHNMFGWFLFFPILLMIFPLADRIESNDSQAAVWMEPGAALPYSAKKGAYYRGLVFVAAVLVTCSGVSARALAGLPVFALNTELDLTDARPVSLPLDPGPIVFAADSVVGSALAEGQSGVRYAILFGGDIDANRVEFFMNQMVPDGWSVSSSLDVGAVRELVIRQGGRLALVRYSQRIGTVWGVSKAGLRRARLSAALNFDRSSELSWALVPCDSECGESERKVLSFIGVGAP